MSLIKHKKIWEGVAQVEAKLSPLFQENPDRDIIVISQPVTRDLHRRLTERIRDGQKHKKLTLFLTTNGGDPDGAYRIARCIRNHYEHVRIVIPAWCKSAGTLITIVADELAIGDMGELGPLDIQVLKNSELWERSSGLDIMQALGAVHSHAQEAFQHNLMSIRNSARLSTKLAGEFAATIAVGVTAPLYAQIDPLRIGEMQRAMRIAHEYGQRLNTYTNSLTDGALERLIADYPAHSFVIDRKEATELFRTVKKPTEAEDNFCTLVPEVQSQSGYGPVFVFPEAPSQPTEEQNNGKDHAESAQNGSGNAKGKPGSVDRGNPAPPDGQGRPIRVPRKSASARSNGSKRTGVRTA